MTRSRTATAAAGGAAAALLLGLLGWTTPASADPTTVASPSVPAETVVAADGDVVLVTAAPGPTGGPAADPVEAAKTHAADWAAAFGAGAREPELRVVGSTGLAGGRTAVRIDQSIDGVPVHAGELVVVVDAAGTLLAISGGLTEATGDLRWTFSPDEARTRARGAAARRSGVPRSEVVAAVPTRAVVDPSLVGRPGDGGRAAWQVLVTDPAQPRVNARVLVDAASGRVVLVAPRGAALDRVVCDGRNRRSSLSITGCRSDGATRVEGQRAVGPRPTVAVDNVFDTLGRTSEFFAPLGVDLTALVGSDAGDGRGRQLRATVRFCPPADIDSCPMVNAFWLDDARSDRYLGGAMFVGDGVTGADDVVAHELTHGVTAATSGLEYSDEPGAINESMSDVIGEMVDQSLLEPREDPAVEAKWLLGEDLEIGAVRSMSDPTQSFLSQPRQPDRMGSPHWWSGSDDDGGVHINSGVGNKAAYLIAAGGTFRGRAFTGLGLRKTAALYWEVLNRLPAGASYAVLGGQLRQACAELATAGSSGYTADDCTQVGAAVDVTEMTKRRVRTTVDASTVVAGERVRLSARVTDSVRAGGLRPHRRATLSLFSRAVGATEWTPVETRPVDVTGQAVFALRPARTTEYRVQATSVGPWPAADSATVTVVVVPPLVLDPLPARAPAGRPLTLTGTVAAPVDPAAPGEVLLQAGRRWTTVARTAPGTDGSFALTWTPQGRGGVRLRVVRPADTAFGRTVSATAIVRIV